MEWAPIQAEILRGYTGVFGEPRPGHMHAGLDIAESPTSKRGLDKIQAQINQWAAKTGLPRRHISRILAMSIGENHTPEEIVERTRSDY